MSIALAIGLVLGVTLFVQYDERRLAASRDAAGGQSQAPRARSVMPTHQRQANTPGAKLLYTCKNGDHTEISDMPCGNVVDVARVREAPRDERARTYREQYDNLVRDGIIKIEPATQPSPGPSVIGMRVTPKDAIKDAGLCENLHAQLRANDAAARLPQSGRQQDHLRKQRAQIYDAIRQRC